MHRSRPGIADRILAANSPIVEDVVVEPPNVVYGGEEKIFVYLVPEATQEQALSLWCDVVLPAGAAQLSQSAWSRTTSIQRPSS
jgi:hypothetical protein